MINENIMVSVIVPVYNVEPFLEKCIGSVLAQTMPDFELILVDDGSTDSSGKICDEYLLKDSRIKVIHKPNGGLSSARNAGLDIAQGKYIYFLDSDDYINPVLLEKTISVMEEKQCDWLGFGMIKENPKGEQIEKIGFKPKELKIASEKERMQFLLQYFLNYRMGWEAWNHVFRKDIITEHNLRFVSEREIFSEDLLFSFMYWLYAESCIILPEMYYHYIQRTDSLMGQSKSINILPKIHKLCVEAYNAVSASGLQTVKDNFEIIYFHLLEWQTRPYITDRGIDWVKQELLKLDYTYFLPADYRDLQLLYRERMKEYGCYDGVISVVIPLLPGCDTSHIEKYIENITLQSLQKLDIILLNDGNTGLEYNDIRVRNIPVEDFSADNIIRTVFDECYGEYIWFADIDSEIPEDFLEGAADTIKYNDCGTVIYTDSTADFVDMASLPARINLRRLVYNSYFNKIIFRKNLLRQSGLYNMKNLQKYWADIVLSDHVIVVKER